MEIITIKELRKKTEKLRKKLREDNICFIVGEKGLISKFCKDKNIQVNYLKDAKIWDRTNDIAYQVGFIDKDSILNVKPTDLEIDEECLLGIRLSDEKSCKRVIYTMDDDVNIFSDISLLESLQHVIFGYQDEHAKKHVE